MTTQTQTAPASSALKWNRVAAVVAWLLGVLFTYLLLSDLAPDAPWLFLLTISGGGQFLLTLAERPLWRWALRRKSGRFVALGAIITLLDGAINAGGIYQFVPNLANTDLGKMLIEVFSLNPKISQLTAAGIALLLGLLVAGLCEYLWEME